MSYQVFECVYIFCGYTVYSINGVIVRKSLTMEDRIYICARNVQ